MQPQPPPLWVAGQPMLRCLACNALHIMPQSCGVCAQVDGKFTASQQSAWRDDCERLALELFKAVFRAAPHGDCQGGRPDDDGDDDWYQDDGRPAFTEVEKLLASGADPNHPLDIFTTHDESTKDMGWFAPRDAWRVYQWQGDDGEYEPYQKELIGHGLALVQAVNFANLALVKLLLNNGAVASPTALVEAVAGAHGSQSPRVVYALLEAGADPNGSVGGVTPFTSHVMTGQGGQNVMIMQLLLCAGAKRDGMCCAMGCCPITCNAYTPVSDWVCTLDAVKADAATRRKTWLGGGLRRWKDLGGGFILLCRLCSQGRAALDNAAAPSAAASCLSTTATLPREIQDKIFGYCGMYEQLGLESAISTWFFRDCGVDVTQEDLDERVNGFDEEVRTKGHQGRHPGNYSCSDCARTRF